MGIDAPARGPREIVDSTPTTTGLRNETEGGDVSRRGAGDNAAQREIGFDQSGNDVGFGDLIVASKTGSDRPGRETNESSRGKNTGAEGRKRTRIQGEKTLPRAGAERRR